MELITLAAGLAIGGLLFGGKSDSKSYTNTNQYNTYIEPILLHFDVEKRMAIITCPKCGGVGSGKDHNCSSCHIGGFPCMKKHDCNACGGTKVQKITIPEDVWQESLTKAKMKMG